MIEEECDGDNESGGRRGVGRKRMLQEIWKLLLKSMDLMTALIALRVYTDKQTVHTISYTLKSVLKSWMIKH
jgi:hypothetical protein